LPRLRQGSRLMKKTTCSSCWWGLTAGPVQQVLLHAWPWQVSRSFGGCGPCFVLHSKAAHRRAAGTADVAVRSAE
jgi:hypothetical protein